jgi:transposase-like protein
MSLILEGTDALFPRGGERGDKTLFEAFLNNHKRAAAMRDWGFHCPECQHKAERDWRGGIERFSCEHCGLWATCETQRPYGPLTPDDINPAYRTYASGRREVARQRRTA